MKKINKNSKVNTLAVNHEGVLHKKELQNTATKRQATAKYLINKMA